MSHLYDLLVCFKIPYLHFSLLFKNTKEQDTCGTLLLRSLLLIFNTDSDSSLPDVGQTREAWKPPRKEKPLWKPPAAKFGLVLYRK